MIVADPLWGIGPPGLLDYAGCGGLGGGRLSAHNVLLQAWIAGGIVGFIAALAAFGGLAWWAISYHNLDDRVLVSVVTCCAVLLGFEVLWSTSSGWVRPTLSIFVVVAARSLQLMATRSSAVESVSAGGAR